MKLNTFEVNKIIMAVLLTLLIIKGGDIIADRLVHPDYLKKNIYIIKGVTQIEPSTAEKKEEKLEPIEPLLAKANAENGQKIAKQCLQCHSFEKGGANKTGPDLWNITKRGVAKASNYAYSTAMQKKGGEWTPENLNAFLYQPRSYVAGTKMSFVGLKKAQDRADLIAYLETLKE